MFKMLYTGFNDFDKKSSRIDSDDCEGKEAAGRCLTWQTGNGR